MEFFWTQVQKLDDEEKYKPEETEIRKKMWWEVKEK